jgi:CBS domain-containing protein
MKIEDVMTRSVVICRPDDNLSRPAQLMGDHDVGCVLVVGDRGELVGLVTDRDIAMSAFTLGRPLSEVSVNFIMADQVRTCRPNESIEVAARRMQRHRVRRLPVVDRGRLVGLVALSDLGRNVPREQSAEERIAALHAVEATLTAVGKPRRLSGRL